MAGDRRLGVGPGDPLVVASWRDWWREFAWLGVPVWVGATVAFAIAYKLVL